MQMLIAVVHTQMPFQKPYSTHEDVKTTRQQSLLLQLWRVYAATGEGTGRLFNAKNWYIDTLIAIVGSIRHAGYGTTFCRAH